VCGHRRGAVTNTNAAKAMAARPKPSRALPIDDEVYASASATNHRNRALADPLHAYLLLGCDPVDAVDLYTRQSCLRVTATDLAVIGATLANGVKGQLAARFLSHRLGLTLFASEPAT
jgi:glutaminase